MAGGNLPTTTAANSASRSRPIWRYCACWASPHRRSGTLSAPRTFIVARGGITQTRIFTKLHLALCGAYDWRGLPSLPPALMLLPENGPFSIYDMSSWARGSTVPLIIVFDRKPIYGPPLDLDELYTEGRGNARFELPAPKDAFEIVRSSSLDRRDEARLERNGGDPVAHEEGVRTRTKRWTDRPSGTDRRLGRHHPRDAQRDARAARARL